MNNMKSKGFNYKFRIIQNSVEREEWGKAD
jgi:hypothetical protein